ncbi:MAG: class I SAM-dependent methyltransferase [Methanothrix sp.]|nr:MAG: class I SAM-dependent methyltransferase [Methanothrix sp.]
MTDTIDWNKVWKNNVLKNRGPGSVADCANIWNEKENAKHFLRMAQEGDERIRMTINGMKTTPESRVLDIGGGPGTLAVPLAKKVACVTVVEPSKGMMSVLQDNIAEHGIENISCVQKRWEDIDPGSDLVAPYDVVFASYSLGMLDIKEAIQKMVATSSKYVYLYWFAGESSWDAHYRAIWPQIHGSAYHPGPRCDVLYNVLYHMGIYPHVEAFPLHSVSKFSSLDEAVERLRSNYQITTENQDTVLRDYLRDVLKEEEEYLVLRGSSIRVRVWWEI